MRWGTSREIARDGHVRLQGTQSRKVLDLALDLCHYPVQSVVHRPGCVMDRCSLLRHDHLDRLLHVLL